MPKKIAPGGASRKHTKAGPGKGLLEPGAPASGPDLAAALAAVDALKTLLDAAPQAMIVLDGDTKILATNQEARAFIGQDDHPTVGLPCGDTLRCEHVVAGTQCGHGVLCGACVLRGAVRETFVSRACIRDRQGQLTTLRDGLPATRHILVSTSFVETVEGSRVLLSLHDITHLHDAHEAATAALRESEERWQFALEGAGDGVWDWNVRTNEVFFSRQWKQMLGYEEHEVANHLREWDKRVHPDDRERVYADLNRHLSGQSPSYVNEHRVLAKDGTYRWILDSGKVVRRAADGSPERVIGTHKDITESKRVEAALRTSEAKFSKAFDNAPVLMTISSLEDGTYLDVNEAFLRTSGFSRDEVIGRTSVGLGWISAGDRSRLVGLLRNTGRITDLGLMLHAKDGREVACIYHGELIHVGGHDRLLSIAVDITDRQQRQREQEVILSILRLAHTTDDAMGLTRSVAELLHAWSRCDAVGIRLRKGDDFPYVETRGLPPEFVAEANSLCAVGGAGESARDRQGNCILECVCGSVLCGRSDPAKPFFTPRGSFWSNSVSQCLAGTTNAADHIRVCSCCAGNGHESVALIPLKAGSHTLGLLQFSDRRSNRFDPDSVEALERVADSFAIVLASRQAKDALREHKQDLASLFDAIHESVFMMDSTGLVLAANTTFAERLKTTISDVIGRSIYALLPPEVSATRQRQTEQVVRTAQGVTFEDERSGRYYRHNLWPITDTSGAVIRLVGFAADITDQRQAAHRLRAMANMLDVAPNSITVHDLAGRFLYANRKSIELHRYSDEAEFLAVNLHDLDVPESAALIDTRIKEAAMAGDARFEVEHFRRDGTRIPLEVFIKTVSWDGVPGIISVATDLTERRAAEEQLRLQALVLDQISDHVTVTDLQGNILYVNEAECRMFGRPRQSIVGQHVRSYGEDRARGAGQDQIIEKTLAQGRWHGEVINYASDGNERIIECRTTLVHDKDGRPIAICGIGTDIGDRKKAEAQLRASEERYRSLVNNIGLGVVLIGSDYRIRSANPAQARLFGKSVEDLVGRECYREFEKRDDVCPGCPGKIALSTGQPHEVDRQGVHDDGLTHLARVRAFPLLDASGCADAFVEVTEDVTQRRQLEIEYRQAQKMEAVGRLAAGVAHDFNNQLTVIQGYSEVLLGRCPEGDPLFEPLSQIRQAAKRAHSTTSHLLSFSRKQILEPGVVDLRDFLNESQAPIARMIGEDITLDVIVDPVCPPVLIDKSGLHQAIMNLVVNARDAMPDGGALALRASGFELAAGEAHEFAEASPGRYVLLEVIDSGLGMSSQTMEHAFEPFFTTKEAGKGTGLGLPMVLGFVRQSKGYLAIRSECGKGTTVRMLLPLARREPEDPIDAAEAVAPTDLHPGRTVLLTEDEEGVRTLLTSILEQSGYRVLSAARPTEAIRISREYEGLIDLLISDVTMPEMPGNELAKVVRSSRPGIRVLLITGYAEHARQTEEEVLQKPFTMKELLDRVVAMIPVEPHP